VAGIKDENIKINEYQTNWYLCGRSKGNGSSVGTQYKSKASEYQQELINQVLTAIVLGIKDVQVTFIELKEKGITFTQNPTTNDFGSQAIFDDTCGNLIRIHQD